jgi:hypothetical protein
MSYSHADLQRLLRDAIDRFYAADSDLLRLGVSERCVSHRLAIHLQVLFPELQVDCEYNRDGPNRKELPPPDEPIAWDDDQAKTVFPDIIVHERGRPESNTLVVEMKKTGVGRLADFDRDKLRAFTGPRYAYELGAFLVFDTGDDGRFRPVEWFSDGRPYTEQTAGG